MSYTGLQSVYRVKCPPYKYRCRRSTALKFLCLLCPPVCPNTRPHCCHLAADMAVMKPGGPVMVAVIGVAAVSLVIDRP